MDNSSSLRRDWEELANLDPFWAILSDKSKQFERWEADEFFATGSSEIAAVMEESRRLGFPLNYERALDFGCGVGRLTRSLRAYFPESIGVDISPTMLEKARILSPDCQFQLLGERQLEIFPDKCFDLIYSNIVLQHQPSFSAVAHHISEFVRVLKRGGLLVFQLPHSIPFRYRLQPRRRLYHALHAIGFDAQLLYNKLHLNPITMLAVPEKQVRRILTRSGAKVLHVRHDRNGGPDIESRTYFATRS